MTEKFVAAIDQGTTGTKLHHLKLDGAFETIAAFEHKQIYPQPGWVEHDPLELIRHLEECLIKAAGACAIGIANQGETVVAWDAKTKRPVYNAIVWQDARTQKAIEALKAAGQESVTLERAGLPLDPYFSASKFRWILDNVPEAAQLRKEKRLRLGTSDSFFLDNLTGRFVTDVTTASRTSLMNLRTCAWDSPLCALFDVPMECLAEIRPTAGVFGEMANGLPVAASVVDQQAALFGHGCRKGGDAKITFGTGAFVLCVTGEKPLRDAASGLLPTVAWAIEGKDTVYALDGGVYNAASAVNWARSLGLFNDYAEIADFKAAPAISRGLAFVPALSGLGCPYWDRTGSGLWLGLGLETSRSDMMQALLEGIALRAGQVLAAMGRLAPLADRLSIDGGLARNGYFGRFLADALDREIIIPSSPELTGLGTAQLALIGAGFANAELLPPAPPVLATLSPQNPLSQAAREKFADAVTRCRNWRTL